MNYNVINLLWQGLSGQKNWPQAWRSPELKSRYDAVIIGGGGHGLATAYYLAREHGKTNIAVLEKGWIGGGNTGRNTTNVRSDYMFPESAKMYNFALKLYETLGKDLNYNIMLSQRGWLTLIHDQHQMEGARHKANWLNCNGVDGQIIDKARVEEMLPGLNVNDNPRFPVRGAFLQERGGTIRHDAVAWGYARAADRLGVDIIQNCEVTGFDMADDQITAVNTSKGRVETGKVGVAVAGHSGVIAEKAGFRLPITSHCLQAMVSEPVKPFLDHVVISPGTGVYINQTQKGEMVMGGVLDHYNSYGQRGNFPTIEKVISSAVEMFPGFSELRLMRHWAGIVDISPDSSPILGQTPVSNMYINCGWGTGGFKAIPAGGYLLAETIAKGVAPEMAQPFGLNRFRDNRLVDEGAAAGIAH
jgi:sarcosine oxidase subunit beta